MLAHRSGMIGLPLRLLAREVFDKIVRLKGAADVALITGEERIVPKFPRYFVCTVEAMPVDIPVAFLAVDEIQLCTDPERGHVFTDRLINARGEEETMWLGAGTMRGAIARIAPETHFITRPRFSDLAYTGPKKLSRLPRRSAIVAFSVEDVYGLADTVRSQRGGAAVVLGALSPRTRNAQVELYQSGEVDFMIATDAIGMGINMDVDHVAFAAREKFDGMTMRLLKPEEIGQIAGRAGRYMNDGTFGVTGDSEPFDSELVQQIENHRYDPVKVLQWRNSALDFGSLDGLLMSLDAPPPARGLIKSRPVSDHWTLQVLARDEDIRASASAPAAVRLLWQACQLPDFRKLTPDEHARLVGQIFRYLVSAEGVLPEDWMARQIARLDIVDGDVDTLSGRLAQIRTWTYAAHRQGWTRDPSHWQEETRAVEDRLSDALHEKADAALHRQAHGAADAAFARRRASRPRTGRFGRGVARLRTCGQARRLPLRARSAGGRRSRAHFARRRAQGPGGRDRGTCPRTRKSARHGDHAQRTCTALVVRLGGGETFGRRAPLEPDRGAAR